MARQAAGTRLGDSLVACFGAVLSGLPNEFYQVAEWIWQRRASCFTTTVSKLHLFRQNTSGFEGFAARQAPLKFTRFN